jgi:hypothetical protein
MDLKVIEPLFQGMVRYWPSIAHEGSSTEISIELGGQVILLVFLVLSFENHFKEYVVR